MRRALVLLFTALAPSAVLSSCTPAASAPTIALSAEVASAPADGLARVMLTAAVSGAPGAVVSFEIAGPGLLGASHALVVDGAATVALFAPLENELGAQASVATTVTATLTSGAALLTSAQVITFTLPTTGAPRLSARAEPDRVLAGGGEPIRVLVDGFRLVSASVSLSTSGALGGLPSSLILDDAGGGLSHGELVIPPAATPGSVSLTLTAEGVAPVTLELRFIAEGEAAFDLNGTFAQVSYSVVEIGNLIFLNPDPQCLVAPTLSLVTIEQTEEADGTRLTMHTQVCDLTMGDVVVHFVGRSTTHVEQPFIDAINADGHAPLSLLLANVSAGASFAVPAEALSEPFILGANLANPRTDPLPTRADDAAQSDDDGDGAPGVTLFNSSQGEQHIAQRSFTVSMNGSIESSNVLSGASQSESESVIFGDSPISPTVTAKSSPWFMKRVDGPDGIAGRDGDPALTCADVKAYASELQALAPPPAASAACD